MSNLDKVRLYVIPEYRQLLLAEGRSKEEIELAVRSIIDAARRLDNEF